MNYTALDFETANSERTSICSVGIVRVENGHIVEKIHQLINPCAPFQYWNTRVHGITSRDVRNAPTFPEFWEKINNRFSDVVVAHNATFDISCLKKSLEHFGLEKPEFDYYCTLRISRKHLPIQNCKLDCVAQYFQLGEFKHHNALDDAITCARIFYKLKNNFDISEFKKNFCEVEQKLVKGVKQKTASEIMIRNKRADISKAIGLNGSQIVGADNFFDYSDIDFSKTFRVVGRFTDMSVGQIESAILRMGGNIVNSVSEYPDYVIVGAKQSVSTAYGEFDDEAYIAKKAGIKVVSERHFLSQVY
ncbi:MAG: hypothetical protein E7035_04625 [Verrucomicrobiaceae bacterium]|nr:hypothetical protein [Verrucomicrobiaceae bacterium]